MINHHFNYQLSTSSITVPASACDMCAAVHSNGDLTARVFNHISNEGNASWLCQPRTPRVRTECVMARLWRAD